MVRIYLEGLDWSMVLNGWDTRFLYSNYYYRLVNDVTASIWFVPGTMNPDE